MQKTFDDIAIFLFVSIGIILSMAGFIITIIFLYRKRQLAYLKELGQIKINHEKNLLKAQLEIQEQTFQAISREIHDNINLSLTLAKLNLNTLRQIDKNGNGERIGLSIDCVSKAIEDLTDISRSINSEIIVNQGLISALTREIEKLEKLNCFKVKFRLCGSPIFLDAQKEIFIFRIIQEAISNILKHAKANNIGLRLFYYETQVNIIITDDGVGFNFYEKTALGIANPTSGLRNMQKRAELLNGRYRLESIPGKGTSIRITIPFSHEFV